MVIANGAFRRGVRGAVPSNLGTGQWHWIFGNTYVTDEPVIQLRYYSAESGQSPFEDWFTDLDAPAAAKVVVALARLEQGNNSNAKGIGEGFLNIASLGAQAIACILAWTVMRS